MANKNSASIHTRIQKLQRQLENLTVDHAKIFGSDSDTHHALVASLSSLYTAGLTYGRAPNKMTDMKIVNTLDQATEHLEKIHCYRD